MKWFLLLPCWFMFNLLAYLLAPILPYFSEWRYGQVDNANYQGEGYRLPYWLAWFDTPDNPLTGDAGHRERTVGNSEYWSMVLWLWRNPAVGFDASVLSADLSPFTEVDLVVKGDPQVQDAPHGREGYCLVRIGKFWNLVYIKKIPLTSRCLKLDLGWQLKTFAESPSRLIAAQTVRYACSVRSPTYIYKP